MDNGKSYTGDQSSSGDHPYTGDQSFSESQSYDTGAGATVGSQTRSGSPSPPDSRGSQYVYQHGGHNAQFPEMATVSHEDYQYGPSQQQTYNYPAESSTTQSGCSQYQHERTTSSSSDKLPSPEKYRAYYQSESWNPVVANYGGRLPPPIQGQHVDSGKFNEDLNKGHQKNQDEESIEEDEDKKKEQKRSSGRRHHGKKRS
ncbi:hypothetical protein B7463_g7150, partial [Scytalidium lignicola]